MASDAAGANFAVVQAAFEKTIVREKEKERHG